MAEPVDGPVDAARTPAMSDAEEPMASASPPARPTQPLRVPPGGAAMTPVDAGASPSAPAFDGGPSMQDPTSPEPDAGSDAGFDAGQSTQQPEPEADADGGLDTPERPDLSCAAFAGTTAGLLACGSPQPWLAPDLTRSDFALTTVQWSPLHAGDGYVALVVLKRSAAVMTETYVSAYLFSEQGECLQHIGTVDNATAFYPIQLYATAARGGTTAALIAFSGRRGVIGAFALLANGKVVRALQGDTRMDVNPQGEIVLAQTPWNEPAGYTLALQVFDVQGTLLREAATASPGLIEHLDASEAGQLVALYRTPSGSGPLLPSRRVDRFDFDPTLMLRGSFYAPENVDLTALDVHAGRVAVSGSVRETANTVWTHVLELSDWTPVWPAAVQTEDLERVNQIDLAADGRVLLVGSATGAEPYSWLFGYGADAAPLWNEPWKDWSFHRVTAQQNGHILTSGPLGFCE